MTYGNDIHGILTPEECFHRPEAAGLMYAAAELEPVDSVFCAGYVALAQGLAPRCEDIKALTRNAGCPLYIDLKNLTDYVEDNQEARYVVAARRAHELRKYPLDPEHTKLEATVDEAAAHAYFILSRATGMDPEVSRIRPGDCLRLSMILRETLRIRGVDTTLRRYIDTSGVGGHFFLTTPEIGTELFDVDATWQQFLPRSTDYSSLPHTLILPHSNKTAAMNAHGIPLVRQEIWESTTDSDIQGKDLGLYPIGRIFEEEGWS